MSVLCLWRHPDSVGIDVVLVMPAGKSKRRARRKNLGYALATGYIFRTYPDIRP